MSWRTIVVAVDDSDASRRALRRAAEIAIATHAKLVVTSAAPVLKGIVGSRGIGPHDPVDPPEAHEATLELAEEYLEQVGVEAETDLEFGEAAASVVAAADKYEADLIVVGTREPGFFGRHLHGRVSQSVARKARCDVLITHS